jgi:hypothetical protein
MNKKLLNICLFFLLLGLCCPLNGIAEEPLDISYSVESHSIEGPTTTITLRMDIKNVSEDALANINIQLASLPNMPFSQDQIYQVPLSLSITNIGPNESVPSTYTIVSYQDYSPEYINSMTMFWNVTYFNSASQEFNVVLESKFAPVAE